MKRVVKVTQADIACINDDMTVTINQPIEFVGVHLNNKQIVNKLQKSNLLTDNDVIVNVKHFECSYEMPIEEFTKLAKVTEIKEVH